MPELPEVETIKRQLRRFLVSHKIKAVEVLHPKIFTGDVKTIIGGSVENVRRFAKVLSIDLSNNYSIVIHIKLTGQLIYKGPNLSRSIEVSSKVIGGVPGPHTHVLFHLDEGGVLYYNDVRRFGWIKIIRTPDVATSDFIGKLGPEPFEGLTQETFSNTLSQTKRAVKVVLMDQTKMGGIGNIYANDALWLSKISPSRPANDLTANERETLFKAILEVLKKGIEAGGASELAYVTPDGQEGKYQNYFLAYGKEGALCPRCKNTKFIKTTLGGRGTYFCPRCQK